MLKTIIVAEIGSNWEGKLSIAKKIIFECKKAGADVVKFQMWRARDLYSETHPEWSTIKKSELTFDKAIKIKQICDEFEIEFMCSVFYPEAVIFLESLGVKRYKIASRITMGMRGSRKKLENIFLKNNRTFCYCISDYPLNFEKINWKKAVNFNGFSDHTMNITAAILFTVLKKQKKSKQIIIEKHVKLKNSKGPDASTSIDTIQLSDLISHVRLIEKTNF